MFANKISHYSGVLQAIRMDEGVIDNSNMSYGQNDSGDGWDIATSISNIFSKAGDVATSFFTAPSTSTLTAQQLALIQAQAAANQNSLSNLLPYILIGGAGIVLIMVLKKGGKKSEE